MKEQDLRVTKTKKALSMRFINYWRSDDLNPSL
ncbi:hypothetical protein ACUXFL_002281 [Staphylococcus lugdunensis]